MSIQTQQTHTPGPWHCRPMNTMDFRIRAAGPDGTFTDPVALVDYKPDNEGSCNARLIAAAPELLEACEAAQYWLEEERRQNPGLTPPISILNRLCKAIAKASNQ